MAPTARSRGARSATTIAALLVGSVLSIGAWLLLVPWDLSEVDARGRVEPSGGDGQFGGIAVVYAIVIVSGAALASWKATRAGAAPFVAGAGLTWVVLFAWRAGSARTSGANMFLLPLVLLVVPAAVVGVCVIAVLQRHFTRRQGEAS